MAKKTVVDFVEDLEPICEDDNGFVLERAQQLLLHSLLLLPEKRDWF